MDIIQTHWEQDEVFGLDSFLFRNGKYHQLNLRSFRMSGMEKTFGYRYELEFGDHDSIQRITAEKLKGLWSGIQVNCSSKSKNDGLVIAGEGDMGNEGFIAMLNEFNELQWTLFSSQSNPFIELLVIDSIIKARSTHNFWLVIETNKLEFSSVTTNIYLEY